MSDYRTGFCACLRWAGSFEELLLDAPRTDTPLHLPLAPSDGATWVPRPADDWPWDPPYVGAVSTRVLARTLANSIARCPNISETHSETRVLEYPFSTPFIHTKWYWRVLRAEDGPRCRPSCARMRSTPPSRSLRFKKEENTNVGSRRRRRFGNVDRGGGVQNTHISYELRRVKINATVHG